MKRLCTAIVVAAFTAAAVWAQSPEDLERAMGARLPAINALKLEGLLGENNQGLLEARGALSDEQRKVLSAENEDRSRLYRLIAERTGASPNLVGAHRAKALAERSTRGVWLQDAQGRWYRKGG